MFRRSAIFISYHKKFSTLEGKAFIPIHVGRAISKTKSKDGILNNYDIDWLSNQIGDDTGDNISHLNREFCELTALYWVWKNYIDKVDYIGLMQYRRHFILNQLLFDLAPKDKEKIAYGCVHFNTASKKYQKAIGLTDQTINSLAAENKIVVPIPGDFSCKGLNSLWEDYVEAIPGVHIDDLIRLTKLLKQNNATLGRLFEDYLNQNKKMMYQMMLMPTSEFDKYCSFLFPIIFDLQKTINVSLYSINGKRTIGYLAELLYGLYFTKLLPEESITHKGISLLTK